MQRLKSFSVAVTLLALYGCSSLYDHLGGDFKGAPAEMDANISREAKNLIRQAFSGMNKPITDHHVHIIARGTMAGCDAYISPDLYTWLHPILMVKTRVLMSASGVTDYEKLDEQYTDRLEELLLHFQSAQSNPAYVDQPVKSRFHIYAMDYYHDDNGQRNLKRTDMYVPDDCVIRLAGKFNRALAEDPNKAEVEIIPVASVHPYRNDFEAAVNNLAEQGVKFIKWLPPAMNINMSKVKKAHYRTLAEAGIILLVHTGDEHAFRVHSDNRKLGDPAALRYALDQGVTIVALHTAKQGRHPEDDDPYFERFMDIMAEEKYRGYLFGEISAVMIKPPFISDSKTGEIISRIIKNTQPSGILSGRIYNGSDYPLPAVALLNPTKRLARKGLIPEDYRKWLNEIYSYNPLLFNFVTKRSIALPGSEHRLPEEVFQQIR